MWIERLPISFRLYYKGAIWRIKEDEKVIYLTFDDGPVPEITLAVLDILDKYGIKATFFCVGENVVKYPEVYAEILRRGHRTGNHTFNHLKGFGCTAKSYIANVAKAAEIIDSNLFRPPYGRITRKQLRLLGCRYKVVLWDLITRDYNRLLSPEFIMKKIRKLSRNGSVVVFHDSEKAKKNLFAVLPQAIEFWQKEGYRFEKL
ncbi:MAG: polysaccharide deacetylase family protein [Prevotellaceae bacterium]|jgi:peptidoglycan/xylan/chitin deacetylase (PgdA/CDA1 family)|nr:polysaccharide deacetylase family protein [Prevotellaceae bacterium]